MGDEWKKELDARNKARAGINEDTIKCDWLRNKKLLKKEKNISVPIHDGRCLKAE